MSFSAFFKESTGNVPYGYQCRLACGPIANPENEATLQSGTTCQSQLINIATGLGKTAAVVHAWLWNRVELEREHWPRRLVYCLPMRTLVEQTEKEVRKWLGESLWNGDPKTRTGKVGVHILMGGEESGEWDIYPEENAILIGTQDMLLSRALNRGYGMSRYRWPMHFALLNNDCLWVMDETQLMGVGVETSAQMDGFRHNEKTKTFGACPTWWMSATLDHTRLLTVDHVPATGNWPSEQLAAEEQITGRPAALFNASKKILSAPLVLNSTTKGDYAKKLAQLVHEQHQALLQKSDKHGSLTLVVLNRVSRARDLYEALAGGKKPMYAREDIGLIHSRFRPIDRKTHTDLLFAEKNRIIIATQAVEAGVDVSARLLISELAPWSSMVQRMGRCNRRAEFDDAEILVVDIQSKDEKDEVVLPYTGSELTRAREALTGLTDACPRILREITVAEEKIVRPIIRRRDLSDLFDTTQDICGQDLDVSRYIRDGEDNDVQFYWRDIDGGTPTEDEPPPVRDELCRVSIGDAQKFFKKSSTTAWRWNPLTEIWEGVKEPRQVSPGCVYLVYAKSGGYSDLMGWTGDPKDNKLTIHRPDPHTADAYSGDRLTFERAWQTIAEHTQLVDEQACAISKSLHLDDFFSATVRTAAIWHDVGKAHPEFQAMLRAGDASSATHSLWAKSPHGNGTCSRYGFRHELASALAWLLAETSHAPDKAGSRERDLVAYVIAAHHGKVRLSIRALPLEAGDPARPNAPFARGIWQDDWLPAIPLGSFTTPEVVLDLGFMQMGDGTYGPSWLARMLGLRDQFGPFRLAFLETVLRAADARASRL